MIPPITLADIQSTTYASSNSGGNYAGPGETVTTGSSYSSASVTNTTNSSNSSVYIKTDANGDVQEHSYDTSGGADVEVVASSSGSRVTVTPKPVKTTGSLPTTQPVVVTSHVSASTTASTTPGPGADIAEDASTTLTVQPQTFVESIFTWFKGIFSWF